MKNALKVFKRDMKNLSKNYVALIVIIGICVIPSLYAWVNIKACWDPYENTNNIPIAVVNNDKGGTFTEEKLNIQKNINIGNDIVEKLKKNDKIDWKFVKSKEAELGVVDGTYYAVIEITENFSKDIVSLVSGNLKKPEIIYKADTKSNPVATKITESAKNTLVDEITTNFVSTVNETVFDSFNKVGKNLNDEKDKIIKVKNSIIKLDDNMDGILSILKGVDVNSDDLIKYLTELKTTMPEIVKGISSLDGNKKDRKGFFKNTKESINNTLNDVEFGLKETEKSIENIKNLLDDITYLGKEKSVSNVNSILSKVNSQIDDTNTRINRTVTFLDNINKLHFNKRIANTITNLKGIANNLNAQKDKINDLQKQGSNALETNKILIDSIKNNMSNARNNIKSEILNYNNSLRKILNDIADNMIKSTDEGINLVNLSDGLENEIDEMLGLSLDGSKLANEVSSKLYKRLDEYKDIISKLSDRLRNVDDKDLIKIISIMQSNPELMGDFISSPFNLKEESIYKIPNYGSAMTPLYTVLALWVGGLILTSVLKTRVKDFEGSDNISIREKYFGKMFTFITFALIQALIVSIGNKLILGVYSVNTFLMILFALVTSLTFSIIIYTCVALFGNVGKAMAIILMIIQIAGSGGAYPIQVNPKIFRILQPFFPFTYAIGGFREAIAGPLISSAILDLSVLILQGIIFIIIGYFLKSPLHNKVNKFEEKFKESGLSE